MSMGTSPQQGQDAMIWLNRLDRAYGGSVHEQATAGLLAGFEPGLRDRIAEMMPEMGGLINSGAPDNEALSRDAVRMEIVRSLKSIAAGNTGMTLNGKQQGRLRVLLDDAAGDITSGKNTDEIAEPVIEYFRSCING